MQLIKNCTWSKINKIILLFDIMIVLPAISRKSQNCIFYFCFVNSNCFVYEDVLVSLAPMRVDLGRMIVQIK